VCERNGTHVASVMQRRLVFFSFHGHRSYFATVNTKQKVLENQCAWVFAVLSAHKGMYEVVVVVVCSEGGGVVNGSGRASGTHARQKFSVVRDGGLNNDPDAE